jgi:peptide/nickel transport system permease protein
MGLDRHPVERYGKWIKNAVQGDLGMAARGGATINDMVKSRLPNSALLAGFAFLIAVPSSLICGILAGTRPDSKFDRIVSIGSLLAISIPEFIIGVILMMVFATKLGWFPSSTIMLPGESILTTPKVLVLPTLTITGALFAYILRMARANVMEVMESNYVRTAILKGISTRQVVFKHVLPNALIPTITVIANNVGWMFGGIIVVEFVFAYPGIGSLLIMAIDTRDMRLLQSTALVIAAIYAFANLGADLIYGLLNPRVRVGQ